MFLFDNQLLFIIFICYIHTKILLCINSLLLNVDLNKPTNLFIGLQLVILGLLKCIIIFKQNHFMIHDFGL